MKEQNNANKLIVFLLDGQVESAYTNSGRPIKVTVIDCDIGLYEDDLLALYGWKLAQAKHPSADNNEIVVVIKYEQVEKHCSISQDPADVSFISLAEEGVDENEPWEKMDLLEMARKSAERIAGIKAPYREDPWAECEVTVVSDEIFMAERNAYMLSIADGLDWSHSCYDDGSIVLSKHSPAGEDFSFTIEGQDISAEVQKCAYDFDEDEHILLWAEASLSGRSGVPSIKELVQDAEDIQTMLDELADAMQGPQTTIGEQIAADSAQAAYKERLISTIQKNGWTYVETDAETAILTEVTYTNGKFTMTVNPSSVLEAVENFADSLKESSTKRNFVVSYAEKDCGSSHALDFAGEPDRTITLVLEAAQCMISIGTLAAELVGIQESGGTHELQEVDE